MMRHRNGVAAGWHTKRSTAQEPPRTCSFAPPPISKIAGHSRLRCRVPYFAKGICFMGPDDARLQDARAWLLKAEADLKAAAYETSAPAEGLWGDVMFHAQQAAEKAM